MTDGHKMPSSAAERKSQFAARKFRWLEKVARDRALPALAPAICIELCHLFNLANGGGAWPWQDEISRALGVRREAINKSLAALVERGHLTSTRQGRDRPNIYHMVLGDGDDDEVRCAPESTSSKSRCAPESTSSDLRCAPSAIKMCANDDLDVRENAHRVSSKKSPKKSGSKRERARSPVDASLKGKKLPAKPQAELVTALDDAFARFWAVYPRKIEQDEARAAFAKAIDGDADSEAIIARAACYGIERATAIAGGDDPKYTLYPATWLRKKKWNDPYPEGVIRDEAGNVVAIEQQEGEDDDGGEDDYGTRLAEIQRLAGVW